MSWNQSQSKSVNWGPLSGAFSDGATAPRNDLYTQEMFIALKQSYEDRIKSLELQIKETYQAIDTDEIVNTMKLSEVSGEYGRLRVQEIVEESLLAEKEAQIDKLIQINVYLKSEFLRSEDEKEKMKKAYYEEIEKFQKTVDEFEHIVQKEVEDKQKLIEENERLTQLLNNHNKEEPNSARIREEQFDQSVQGYQNEIYDLKQELEQLKIKTNEKDEIIQEMTSDIETMRDEFLKLEETYNQLVGDYNRLKELSQETDSRNEGGISSLQQRLVDTENELRKTNNTLHAVLAEKADLIGKSEDIAAQAKQIVEKEQRNVTNTIEGLQSKYKEKKLAYKRRIDELNAQNQEVNEELGRVRLEINETRRNNQNLTLQMENNIKAIQNEWESRCREMEISSEKAIGELTAKYQVEINQLQTEYQSVIDRKLSELQNEASNQLSKTKGVDIELKAQLENRMIQMEKDYITKTKHEHILTNELLDQRAKHAREVRELEERLESEYNNRIKDAIGRTRNEYDNDLTQVKTERKDIEQQFVRSENLNQKNQELIIKEKQKSQKLSIELTEAEKKIKELKAHFDQATLTLNKLKKYCEEESKINRNLEQSKQEMAAKIQSLEKKEASSNQLIAMLRNEISSLNDNGSAQRNKVIEIEAQSLSFSDQIERLEKYVDKLEAEKVTQNQRIQELSDELNKASQRVNEINSQVRKETEIQLEKEAGYRKALEDKLHQSGSQNKTLETKLTEKAEVVEELQANIDRLEKINNQLRNRNQEYEEDLKNVRLGNKDLQKGLDKSKRSFEEKISKIWRLLMFKVESLRSEVTTIRANCKSELQIHQHSNQEVMRQLVNHFQGKMSFDKLRLQEERRRELQDIREEYEERVKSMETEYHQERDHEKSSAQKLIDNYIKENKVLTSTVEEVKRDFKELMNGVEKTNQENLEYRRKISSLEDEVGGLKRIGARKDEESEALQQFVKGELKRIKDDSNQITKEIGHQMRSKNLKDLGMLVQAVDELKHSNIRRLKQFEAEIMNYEVAHEKELIELADGFQKEIGILREELRQAEEEIVRKEEEKKSLKIDYDKVCERYKELHQDNEEMFVKFEAKLANFKEMMKVDNENYLEKRNQANAEIEKLRNSNKDLSKEIKEKSFHIEELNLRVKYYKEDINKYKGLLDHRVGTAEKNFGDLDALSPSFGANDPNNLDFMLQKSISSKSNYRSPQKRNHEEKATPLQDDRRYQHQTNLGNSRRNWNVEI